MALDRPVKCEHVKKAPPHLHYVMSRSGQDEESLAPFFRICQLQSKSILPLQARYHVDPAQHFLSVPFTLTYSGGNINMINMPSKYLASHCPRPLCSTSRPSLWRSPHAGLRKPIAATFAKLPVAFHTFCCPVQGCELQAQGLNAIIIVRCFSRIFPSPDMASCNFDRGGCTFQHPHFSFGALCCLRTRCILCPFLCPPPCLRFTSCLHMHTNSYTCLHARGSCNAKQQTPPNPKFRVQEPPCLETRH